jgi:hypothetical protein
VIRPEAQCAVCVLTEAVVADETGALTVHLADLPPARAVWRGTPLCVEHLVDVATHAKFHVRRRRVYL